MGSSVVYGSSIPRELSLSPVRRLFAGLEHAHDVAVQRLHHSDPGLSDGRDNGLSGFAGSAIVYAQIETRCLRFDTGQYQRPAAFGARRPKVIDELKFERGYHSRINQPFCGENSESIPHNVIRTANQNRPTRPGLESAQSNARSVLGRGGRPVRRPYLASVNVLTALLMDGWTAYASRSSGR
jgi:hypothetical protein